MWRWFLTKSKYELFQNNKNDETQKTSCGKQHLNQNDSLILSN